MRALLSNIREFLRRKEGVTAIEYAILAAGIAVVIGALVSTDGPFATAINDLFNNIIDQLPQQNGTTAGK